MRKRFEAQLSLEQLAIEKVVIPLKSRDQLPPTLAGLKWIFSTPEINEQVFELLDHKVGSIETQTCHRNIGGKHSEFIFEPRLHHLSFQAA